MKWEQKFVTQTLKTLAVNSFITWRMHPEKDIFQRNSLFRSFDSFRLSLNSVSPIADFVFDLCKDLLIRDDSLERQKINSINELGSLSKALYTLREVERLVQLSRKKRRYRISFFSSEDGKKAPFSNWDSRKKIK